MAAASLEPQRYEGLAAPADPTGFRHQRNLSFTGTSSLEPIVDEAQSRSRPRPRSCIYPPAPPRSGATSPTDSEHSIGTLERRTSQAGRNPKATLNRQRSVGGGSKSLKRISWSGKPGLGPILPVVVAMADETSSNHGAASPAALSDTFEEAQETATSPPAAEGVSVPANRIHAIEEKEEQNESAHGQERPFSWQQPPGATPQLPERPTSGSPTSPNESISSSKRVAGLSGEVPLPIPGPPPSSADRMNALQERHIGERPSSASPPGGAKKAGGFAGLFGRMGSIRRTGKSPPAPTGESLFTRRNTTISLDSAGASSLAAIADTPGSALASPSLQDQFTSLRKQEEYSSIPGANGYYVEPDERPTTPGHARKSSGASATGPSSPVKTRTESTSSMKSPPMDPGLPPGTASGMTAGPAEEPRAVDWDLWQALVMEGPGAVAKTSGKELSQAIASGIPAAIRGVVWQILAESKNEELEAMYYTLKSKGSGDVETGNLRPGPASRSESQSNLSENNEGTDKLAKAFSGESSIHSGSSTPPGSNNIHRSASATTENGELRTKLLIEKQKREAAALSKLEKAIKRDMGSRTSYSKYTQSAGLQDGLFGVCKAYALFDEGVGYAQGINFIAMPLLFNMGEGEAFALLVRLMSKYDVRSLFMGDMTGLHLRLYQFERLLEDHEPALYCHLKRRNVGPQLYATQWFLTMFAYRFPLQLVLRVYDLVFSEGLTAILKFGIVLMQRNRDALLEMKDMGHLTNFLKEKVFDVYIDKSPSASSLLDSGFFGSVTGGADKELYRADEMVRDACEIEIPKATLAGYTLEWEEQQRITQGADAELEHLRTTNTSLTAQVKILEERTQQQDTEHVHLAGEVVRVKVENDSLHDEVEGLKLRNEELQRMVTTQPDEVEEKLREEMQRIMQRNIEVQNENRALKEDMDEMERALVESKMQHAQTQSDHDSLKQRLSSVQAMLNLK